MTTTDRPVVTPEPLEPACEWRADEVGDSYIFPLTDEHVAELDAALVHAEARADDVLDITRDLFPLPTLGPELARITRELIDGRGMVLIRGVPVERYTKDRASAIYWGVGTHMGYPWPQNAKGHLLGDVTDQGRSPSDPTSRGNELGGIALPFHSDGSDLVGLFCLDAGAGGGDSLVANAVTIHNDLVRAEPELAAALYEPFPYDLRGEQAPGARSWYTMPIFSRRAERLFVRYIRPYIEASRRHDDAPRPSALGREAMDRLDAMCAEPQYRVAMGMQPGDMQFVNNYHVLHGRDAYQDDRAAGKIRHLKRLWLETEVLTDDEKPERFRLGRTDSYWSSKGPTKSELSI
ncbi:MAG TPA: TauD/TfdA family dioxygenase [Acidimicrobiales bacterium]|nr:TauD/TfdA family dioxygenase [Acidimicrobiales bacterium]